MIVKMDLKFYGKGVRYVKRAAGIAGAVIIFCMITGVMNYIYASDYIWERILWHNFYKDDGKIENIYLGSSHVYCDLNPRQLDDINGRYNFNLSSSGQTLNGSYYLLREADKNNNLSHVYLELYYWCSVNYSPGIDMIDVGASANWKNTDYMKNSYNKCSYMLSLAGTEKYADIFFPFIRYRTKLGNWDYIIRTMEAKGTDEYSDFEFYFEYDDGNGYEEYKQQGYYCSTREFPDGQRLYNQNRVLDKDPMGEKSERYLRKIICYCQERGIPITLFVSPIDELQLISTEHYDYYVDQVREIAGEYGVEFYDFNLIKEEYLDIQHGEYFMDAGHLNNKGADMFTAFFSMVVSERVPESEKLFYTSYEEKRRNTPPSVYGLYYRDSEGIRTFHVASNKEEGIEYRITLTQASEEPGGVWSRWLYRILRGIKSFP